jgi:hypothetical protein
MRRRINCMANAANGAKKLKKSRRASMAAGFSRVHMQLLGNDLLILTGC